LFNASKTKASGGLHNHFAALTEESHSCAKFIIRYLKNLLKILFEDWETKMTDTRRIGTICYGLGTSCNENLVLVKGFLGCGANWGDTMYFAVRI
jgi:hypothetical protein